jgi:hypothetical protein
MDNILNMELKPTSTLNLSSLQKVQLIFQAIRDLFGLDQPSFANSDPIVVNIATVLDSLTPNIYKDKQSVEMKYLQSIITYFLGSYATDSNTAFYIADQISNGYYTIKRNPTADASSTISALLLNDPTNAVSADLRTARLKLTTILGTTLETDIQNLNSQLAGSSFESTIQDRISGIDSKLLIVPTHVIANDLETARSLQVNTLGLTLQNDIETINSSVNGVSTGSNLQTRIDDLSTLIGGTGLNLSDRLGNPGTSQTIIGNIGGSTTSVVSAITGIKNNLGGSGAISNRVNAINSTLDGVQSLSGLATFKVSSPATNFNGIVSLIGNDGSAGQMYNIDTGSGGINLGDGTGGTTSIPNGGTFALINNIKTITFLNNSGGFITSANALTAYLSTAYPVSFVIKVTTNTKTTALKTFLGGAGFNAMGNATEIDNTLLLFPTSVISMDLMTARSLLLTFPSSTLETDIQTLNSLLNGVGSGSNLQNRIGNPVLGGISSNLATIIGGSASDIANQLGDPGDSKSLINNIDGSNSSIQEALNSLSTLLFNNSNFGSSLSTQVNSLSTTVDNGLNSLPNNANYAVIGTVATSDGSGGVNLFITSGLGLAGNANYNLSGSTITNGLSNGGSFTLTNGSYGLVLNNRSGSTLTTQIQVLNYLTTMYPTGSRIAVGLSDKILGGVNSMLGGSGSSTRVRIAKINAVLLQTPTGILATDLITARFLLVDSPSATLQTDIEIVNSMINGNTTGSTLQARIGEVDNLLVNTATGVITNDLITVRKMIVPNLGSTTQTDISDVSTLLDGQGAGAFLTGGGGSGLIFISSSTPTSYLFTGNEVSVNGSIVSISLGSSIYSFAVSSSDLLTGDVVTFVSNEETIILSLSQEISNGNADANANDLQSLLSGLFQAGSYLTAGNLSSRIANVQRIIDGETSANLAIGLTQLGDKIDGLPGFTVNGLSGTNFIVTTYTGSASQIFGSNAFNNNGTSTLISVTLGTDTYTYDNTGITNLGGYAQIVFSNNGRYFIISNNTGTPITASTDQQLTDLIISMLNSSFISGCQLVATNFSARVGSPTVNSSASNLANVIGGPASDLANRLGDPVGGTQGLSGLIQAQSASNGAGIWTDLGSFQNTTNLSDQLNSFLALFSTNQLTNTSATSITFTLSGSPPTSLADLISKATSISEPI